MESITWMLLLVDQATQFVGECTEQEPGITFVRLGDEQQGLANRYRLEIQIIKSLRLWLVYVM
ncbi:hypothetical protein RchiOBHm_Chr2g0161311 [Rosa chinensis]|uniref:Uncharacterized protein n=1 Tax=Rosa chinensis TaxID=74649 RepID=A0A2P6S2Q7_ROSCH|nr:hypothetical protein RchiOBHm_Chr2g0161311 [Rosa chinensis]